MTTTELKNKIHDILKYFDSDSRIYEVLDLDNAGGDIGIATDIIKVPGYIFSLRCFPTNNGYKFTIFLVQDIKYSGKVVVKAGKYLTDCSIENVMKLVEIVDKKAKGISPIFGGFKRLGYKKWLKLVKLKSKL